MTNTQQLPQDELVFRKVTPYQTIELHKDDHGYLLLLNDSPQVHTHEEKLYHEIMSTLPMMLAEKAENVVILGGGDGLAARNLLHFPDLKKITLVELDKGVLDLCSEFPEWIKLTEASLTNPRVTVVVGDAFQWIVETKETFDLIIHDVEDISTDQPQDITVGFYANFYQGIHDKLNTGGLWVTTIDDEDASGEMLDIIFAARRDMFPQKIVKQYQKALTTKD